MTSTRVVRSRTGTTQ